jgi:hypothetical protein
MRILLWHVHGSWTTSFVQGQHEYLLPVTPDRGPDGLGRARTWDWPERVREVPVPELADTEVDLVVLQRPHELELAHRWLGRRPGRDVAAVYVEHNTPAGDVPDTRHPLAGQDAIAIAHVTAFNDLFWDCDGARTVVIDHGIVDPGHRYTGEVARAAVGAPDLPLHGAVALGNGESAVPLGEVQRHEVVGGSGHPRRAEYCGGHAERADGHEAERTTG